MNCNEYKDLFPLYLLDGLSAEEREALQAHLHTGCPRCAASLAEAEAVFTRLALAVSPVTPPALLREQLLKRVAAKTSESPLRIGASANPSPGRRVILPWAFATAASIAAVCLGAWGYQQQQARYALQQDQTHQAAKVVDLLNTVNQQNDRIKGLQSSRVQVIAMKGTPNQAAAAGRLFLDHKDSLVSLAITGLTPPPPGKTYELWIVTTDAKKIPVGIFSVNPDGQAFLQAQAPTTSVALIAITDEPSLMPQPTGHFQLTGAPTQQ